MDPESEDAARPSFTGVRAIVEACARLTEVDGAAVALLGTSRNVRQLVYATDPRSLRLDELQFTVGEGPCVDAQRNDEPVRIDDITGPEAALRWPMFSHGAEELGVRGLFAYPLGTDVPFGALEMHRLTPGDLTAAQHDAAFTCAASLTTGILATFAHPTFADRSGAPAESDDRYDRRSVYLAAGMVAVQLRASTSVAMDRLRAHAFAEGMTLTDIADDVVSRRLTFRDEGDRP
ncbi:MULTISPECIES: GAF and ANTAR domain-containing protein [Nocardiaceae]|uniref:GAF and ANTAR domain-containing protein n=1 Tax=Rhodococcoides kroppenstedtii TaxID=293050 RepID=A0ABS7NTH0_9NOCA|nr:MULTISPECIES: GAF and ANTAR domain-containing protein [Rhodococcus]AMY20460.1 hypothetical protein A3Q40_03098 [Rhodococcus sp. PBTS 1]MBY6315319.1 GAF and ANTAR domain-containing protein [Rhodococcus kroppenstedtii]MBY6321305.1 GAF and ANTAR domain-containing protein [Rhodococcus kroppenstedtii]MBY6400005.1 GAF and ANTAR domain-containing protein [Rhodococcus kroppenstedtii]